MRNHGLNELGEAERDQGKEERGKKSKCAMTSAPWPCPGQCLLQLLQLCQKGPDTTRLSQTTRIPFYSGLLEIGIRCQPWQQSTGDKWGPLRSWQTHIPVENPCISSASGPVLDEFPDASFCPHWNKMTAPLLKQQSHR